MIGLLMGVGYAIGFSISGLKFGITLGLLFGLLNIVPYLGSIVGIITALLVAYLQPGGNCRDRRMECFDWVWYIFCDRPGNRELLPDTQNNGTANWSSSRCGYGLNLFLGYCLGRYSRHDIRYPTDRIYYCCLAVIVQKIF